MTTLNLKPMIECCTTFLVAFSYPLLVDSSMHSVGILPRYHLPQCLFLSISLSYIQPSYNAGNHAHKAMPDFRCRPTKKKNKRKHRRSLSVCRRVRLRISFLPRVRGGEVWVLGG